MPKIPRAQQAVMAGALAEFLAKNRLEGRETLGYIAREIVNRLGGGAAAAKAAGYTPAARGKPGGKEWEAAKRAYQRAATGQQVPKGGYLGRLFGAATADEQERIAAAGTGAGRKHVQWPAGAAVRVTVAGDYDYSEDDRSRDDLWAEMAGDDLDRLLSDPWGVWDAKKGVLAGRTEDPYMPGLAGEFRDVSHVRVTWVKRGNRDGIGEF